MQISRCFTCFNFQPEASVVKYGVNNWPLMAKSEQQVKVFSQQPFLDFYKRIHRLLDVDFRVALYNMEQRIFHKVMAFHQLADEAGDSGQKPKSRIRRRTRQLPLLGKTKRRGGKQRGPTSLRLQARAIFEGTQAQGKAKK